MLDLETGKSARKQGERKVISGSVGWDSVGLSSGVCVRGGGFRFFLFFLRAPLANFR